MASRAKKHINKYRKHYLLTILGVLAFIAIMSWVVVIRYKPILSERLKQQVYIATDSLYHIDYSGVHLNPILGKFTLDSFQLIPDAATYSRLAKEDKAPPYLFKIFVGEFKLRNIHLWSLIENRVADISVVKIENPVISVYQMRNEENADKRSIRKALAKLISGSLNSIKIDHIGLHNIKFKFIDSSNRTVHNLKLDNMDLIFEDIKIDSSTLKDSTRFLFAKRTWFHLDQSQFFTEDSLYRITLQGIGLSVNEKRLTIDNLEVLPQVNRKTFLKQFSYRKSIFRGSAHHVKLEGFDINKLGQNKYHLKKVSIGEFNLDIYLNRRLPLNPARKPLPQELLQKVNKDLYIGLLFLENGAIEYRELNPHSGMVGHVTFDHIHGSIHNITNDASIIHQTPHCLADLEAQFMGKGKLQVHFDFNLLSPIHAFTYKGMLKDLKAVSLNPATRPLGLIKVGSGRIHELNFHFNANDKKAVGRVGMRYDRLKISILSKDTEEQELKKKGLASLAANLLIIKESSGDAGKILKQTQVNYNRDPQRSVFSLMWKSIFQGVKNIVGVDKTLENKLKTMVENWKENKKSKTGTDKESLTFQEITKFLNKNL